MTSDTNMKLLPDWFTILGGYFLRNVQSLHDYNVCWEVNKLSLSGKEEVRIICDRHELDTTKFSKFLN
jgi:hypothetical protein